MTTRLLRVTTPPEDDPCAVCRVPDRAHDDDFDGHPFTGPVEVTAEMLATAMVKSPSPSKVTYGVGTGAGDVVWMEPWVSTLDVARAILAALAAPREDGA